MVMLMPRKINYQKSLEEQGSEEEDVTDKFLRLNPGNKIRKKAIGVDLSDL